MKPKLIVVTGMPGSGKTTLASLLSDSLYLPLLSRDKLKEGLICTHNSTHAQLSPSFNEKLYRHFFDVVKLHLDNEISLLIEAAFQHKLWDGPLTKLSEIATVKLIICQVDSVEAVKRMEQRLANDPLRDKIHGDRQNIQTNLAQQFHYQPPRMKLPTIEVNCADGYDPSLLKIKDFVG